MIVECMEEVQVQVQCVHTQHTLQSNRCLFGRFQEKQEQNSVNGNPKIKQDFSK